MDTEIQELKAKLEQEKVERARKMMQYLQVGLEKFNCEMVAVPQIIQDGRIVANIQIIAKD